MSQHTTRPEGAERVEYGGDDFDALTELFLGDSPMGAGEPADAPGASGEPAGVLRIARDEEDDWDGPSQSASPTKPLIRGLVLGHLPVFASAWANQYARHLGREAGQAVAVLRIRGGESAVQLVNYSDPEPARCTSLREAIEAARAITPHWVIRASEMDEPALASSDKVDEITLLTGVDEAAVVASYRTLKRLIPEDGTAPELTIAVMGADEARATPIAEKISQAARTFLERDVRVVCCIEKISGGSAAELFTGEPELTIEEAIERIAAPGGARPIAPQVRTAAPPPDPETRSVWASSARPAQRSAGLIEPRPMQSAPSASAPTTTESGASTTPIESRVSIEEITTLEARCPYAPEIRLGVDGQGGLHAIAPSGLDVDAALRSLATARSWAVDHRDLIALTRPDARIGSGREEPVAHLITRSPPEVRRVLDTHVRVHLEVEAGGAVVLVPLN